MLSQKQKNEIRVKALINAFKDVNKRLESEILLVQEFQKAFIKLKEKKGIQTDEAVLKQLEKQIEDLKQE